MRSVYGVTTGSGAAEGGADVSAKGPGFRSPGARPGQGLGPSGRGLRAGRGTGPRVQRAADVTAVEPTTRTLKAVSLNAAQPQRDLGLGSVSQPEDVCSRFKNGEEQSSNTRQGLCASSACDSHPMFQPTPVVLTHVPRMGTSSLSRLEVK